jgi:hypothetical protein
LAASDLVLSAVSADANIVVAVVAAVVHEAAVDIISVRGDAIVEADGVGENVEGVKGTADGNAFGVMASSHCKAS